MFEVRKSEIHGKGLFAKEFIYKGEQLGYFQWRTPRNQKEIDGPYGLDMGEGFSVIMTCHFKYLNSSPNPNTVLYSDYSVYALKDIEKGEELVSNYEDWL